MLRWTCVKVLFYCLCWEKQQTSVAYCKLVRMKGGGKQGHIWAQHTSDFLFKEDIVFLPPSSNFSYAALLKEGERQEKEIHVKHTQYPTAYLFFQPNYRKLRSCFHLLILLACCLPFIPIHTLNPNSTLQVRQSCKTKWGNWAFRRRAEPILLAVTPLLFSNHKAPRDRNSIPSRIQFFFYQYYIGSPTPPQVVKALKSMGAFPYFMVAKL